MHRLYLHEDFLESVLVQERAQLLAIGMVQTHVHTLIRAHPSTMLPRVLQRAKGYSAQSVSWRALDPVREYVLNQERRHPHEAIDGWGRTPAR